MTSSARSSMRHSTSMERTGQWVISQEIPSDIVVEVGGVSFPLHKFMLVGKSNYIRKMIVDSKEPDLGKITLSGIPGGPAMFEKAAMFCYGVNFEINKHNVAGIRCAAEFLQMTDEHCSNNLIGRTDEFLSQVSLSYFSSAVTVLASCEKLLPMAEDIHIVQKCVDVISSKAINEANFPNRSPPNWWAEELASLSVGFLGRVITGMRTLGAKALTIASLLMTYTEKNVTFVGDVGSQKQVVESIISFLPTEKSVFPVNYLCCLLRLAILMKSSASLRNELEKRIAVILEQATVDDLLLISSLDGKNLTDLESIKKIVSGFVEKEKTMSVFMETATPAMTRLAKLVDAYLAAIAAMDGLSISKFNGVAIVVPKAARKVDDDLYRAVDIYLKAHPSLEEIEREKVCSVMEPLKLSSQARLHASQNKRLPVQIVLHALYYDQLKIRSGTSEADERSVVAKSQQHGDAALIRENEALRCELMKMKMYVSEMKNKGEGSCSGSGPSKGGLFTVVSKTLGKLNPFRNAAKDTSNIGEKKDGTKPKRRRFSIS